MMACLTSRADPLSNDCPASSPRHRRHTEQLLNRLRADAARGRIRVEDMFRDFDRHRDGTITVAVPDGAQHDRARPAGR